jgi:uncharacterized protein YjbI with pentapeptide repeats
MPDVSDTSSLFYREAGLISTTSESIMSLKQADLRKINFSKAYIEQADLNGANLVTAKPKGTSIEAYLARTRKIQR